MRASEDGSAYGLDGERREEELLACAQDDWVDDKARPVCAGMHLGQRTAAGRQSHVDMRDAIFEVDLTIRLEAVRTVETL
jgi:hypothetical protein